MFSDFGSSGDNSCAALSGLDRDRLLEIARLEAGSRTYFIAGTEKIGALASKAVPDWVLQAVEGALKPILLGASKIVAQTHMEQDEETWLGWLTSFLNGETFHKVASTVSGIVGGSGGLATAAVEVGVSTTLIIRSIQDVAKSYGEDLSDPSTQIECLSVLGKGGPQSEDDILDEAYWATRAGLKKAVTPELIVKGLESEFAKKVAASQAFENLLTSAAFKKVIERFGITSQAALIEKAVPVVGGLLGGLVNYQYISYYQSMTHVNFRLKAIAKQYDDGQVESCYRSVLASVRKRA